MKYDIMYNETYINEVGFITYPKIQQNCILTQVPTTNRTYNSQVHLKFNQCKCQIPPCTKKNNNGDAFSHGQQDKFCKATSYILRPDAIFI